MVQSTLEKLAADIGNILTERGLKLATAESCTGGGISYYLTAVPGSSDWFDCGFVTYSNTAKIDMLGVKPSTLDKHGAVSKEVAIEMAEGALKNSDADISIAVTGIAGPDGGTKEKPVGTVWLAWAYKDASTKAILKHYSGSRNDVRAATIETALEEIIESAS